MQSLIEVVLLPSTEHNEMYVETKVQPNTKEFKQIGLVTAVQKERMEN